MSGYSRAKTFLKFVIIVILSMFFISFLRLYRNDTMLRHKRISMVIENNDQREKMVLIQNHTKGITDNVKDYLFHLPDKPHSKVIICNESLTGSDKDLKRSLNATTRLQFLSLMDSLRNILSAEGIEMVMCDGTLLGSYFFHDIIPWDDDVDVMIHIKHRAKIFKIFANETLRKMFDVRSFHSSKDFYTIEYLKNPSKINLKEDLQFKFYRTESPNAGKYEWKWPFIDIKYFDEKNNEVFKVQVKSPDPSVPYDKFFPLKNRPMGPYWFLSPADTKFALYKKFPRFSCKSSTWNHEHEKSQKSIGKDCSDLLAAYPHVQRIWSNGKAYEILMLREKMLQIVQVQEPFYHSTCLFDLKIR